MFAQPYSSKEFTAVVEDFHSSCKEYIQVYDDAYMLSNDMMQLSYLIPALLNVSVGTFSNIFYTVGKHANVHGGLAFWVKKHIQMLHEQGVTQFNEELSSKEHDLLTLEVSASIMQEAVQSLLDVVRIAYVKGELALLGVEKTSSQVVDTLDFLKLAVVNTREFFLWAKRKGYKLPQQVERWLIEYSGQELEAMPLKDVFLAHEKAIISYIDAHPKMRSNDKIPTRTRALMYSLCPETAKKCKIAEAQVSNLSREKKEYHDTIYETLKKYHSSLQKLPI